VNSGVVVPGLDGDMLPPSFGMIQRIARCTMPRFTARLYQAVCRKGGGRAKPRPPGLRAALAKERGYGNCVRCLARGDFPRSSVSRANFQHDLAEIIRLTDMSWAACPGPGTAGRARFDNEHWRAVPCNGEASFPRRCWSSALRRAHQTWSTPNSSAHASRSAMRTMTQGSCISVLTCAKPA
jgi:hypothetical protein